MSLKFDAISKLSRWCRRRTNHLRQVLNDKLYPAIPLRQIHTHKPMAPSNIHESTTPVIDLCHIIVVKEILNLIPLSTSETRHRTAEALPANRVFAQSSEHGLFGVEGDLKAALVVLLGAWEFLHSVDGCCGRLSCVTNFRLNGRKKGSSGAEEMVTYWEHILGAEAEPVLHGFVLGDNSAGSGMADDAGADFFEDAVGHGMADESTEVHLVHIDLCGNLLERSVGSDWESIG